jgi:hypothetical protein
LTEVRILGFSVSVDFLGTTFDHAESNISRSAHPDVRRRLQQSVGFGYTPQSTKFPERFMSIADRVRRLSVLLKRSAATVVVGAALVSSLIASLEAQDKKKPDWKDAAEYDLYKPITQTPDPKIWMDTLDKWTKQYPQSELADIRRQLYLETYRQLGRTRDAFNAAVEVLRDNPNNLFALSTIVDSIYKLTPRPPRFWRTSMTSTPRRIVRRR